MKVSLVQVASPDEETPAARRQRVEEMVLGAKGSDLVVLPELWAAGYFAFEEYQDRAESLDGSTVQCAMSWARTMNAHVHLGSIVERDPSGRLHNTAILVDPSGAIVHTYRKIHVFGYKSREVEMLTAGDSISVATTALGPVAATTCYDLRFPELWRSLVDAGAETVIVPAAWPAARRRHWQTFTECRAIEEQVLVVACNAVGTQSGVELGGYSRVVDPWGQILLQANDAEGVFTCDVPSEVVPNVRKEFGVLNDRVAHITTAPSTPSSPTK